MIELAIAVAFGFYLGWRLRELYAQAVVNRYLKKHDEEQVFTKENTVVLELHKEHDMFYIYEKESKTFLVQVKTKEEFIKYVEEKYKNKNVIMTKDQLAMFDTV